MTGPLRSNRIVLAGGSGFLGISLGTFLAARGASIVLSRVESTRVLGMAMRSVDSPPPVWVQMSTAHIYGDPPDVTCTEESPFGYGLAPFVGRAWEEEFRTSVLPSQRQVVLRTSFV